MKKWMLCTLVSGVMISVSAFASSVGSQAQASSEFELVADVCKDLGPIFKSCDDIKQEYEIMESQGAQKEQLKRILFPKMHPLLSNLDVVRNKLLVLSTQLYDFNNKLDKEGPHGPREHLKPYAQTVHEGMQKFHMDVKKRVFDLCEIVFSISLDDATEFLRSTEQIKYKDKDHQSADPKKA